jgi:hypothetical protein
MGETPEPQAGEETGKVGGPVLLSKVLSKVMNEI